MSPAVLAPVLAAAMLHAPSNASLKSGADRLRFITVMPAAAVACLPSRAVLPGPAAARWPAPFTSTALHLGDDPFLSRGLAHERLLGLTGKKSGIAWASPRDPA